MATKLYLTSTSGGTPISPAVSASWTSTAAGFFRGNCNTTKDNSTLTDFANTPGSTATNNTTVWAQFISPALSGAQTITGTISGAVWAKSSVSNEGTQIIVRVIASNGTTVRGTLITTFDSDPSNTTTTGQSEWYNADTLTSVSAQDGDYIVIEHGFVVVSSGAYTGTFKYGSNQASDYAYTAGDSSTTKNPSFQFSQTLTFQAGGGGSTNTNQLMMVGCGT